MVHLNIPPGEELMAKGFGSHSCIDKDQGRTEPVDGIRDPLRLTLKAVTRTLNRDLETLGDRDFHHRKIPLPAEEPSHLIGIPDGSREPDPLEFACVGDKTFQGNGEL